MDIEIVSLSLNECKDSRDSISGMALRHVSQQPDNAIARAHHFDQPRRSRSNQIQRGNLLKLCLWVETNHVVIMGKRPVCDAINLCQICPRFHLTKAEAHLHYLDSFQ